MPKPPFPGDPAPAPADDLYRVVAVGHMPDDPDTPALLLEWDEGGYTYRCWAPASDLTPVTVH